MKRLQAPKLIAAALFLITLVSGLPPKAMAQANVTGQWQTLSNQMPINPVHVALMRNGKILVVSGSGNVPTNTNFQAGVLDPATWTTATQPVAWDMFCNAMLVLSDGRIVVNGGTLTYDPFHGQPKTSIYDPATGQFVDVQNMAHGRWYPTVTTLGDGTFMTFSGLDEISITNTAVEIYKVGSGWSQEYGAGWTPPLYPRMHLLPNGTVFYSGSTVQSSIFNPATHTWAINVAITNYSVTRTYGSSVLLPLTPVNAYKPKVLILGGGSPATATTELIDLSVANPSWVYGPSMSQPRIEMNATILPNGKVLALGGSLNDEDLNTPSLNADLYDPNTNTMSSAGANAYPRLYHSVSLLLPDGTVWFAGGNPSRGSYEPHMEIYSPAYLFNANGTLATRPAISSVPAGPIGYGTAFQVQTPDAANISSVVLMRAGAATHAFDMEQRFVGLSYTVGSGVLNVTGPPSSNIAPPGYYMLFILNSAGVPSVSKFVQVLANPAAQPPTASITTPATDVTISEGQAVSFSGTGTDPSGTITAYSWSFPGGTPSSSTVQNPGNVTYSAAGTFTASLTTTDNSGLTSTPATRTITVQPLFSLSAAPNSQTAVPGGAASYTVTLTQGTGSTGAVTFSASGLPGGATAAFSPTSLSASGSTTMTISTTSLTSAGSYPLTITGTSAGVQHTAAVTLVVSAGVGGGIQFVQSNYATPQTALAQVQVKFLAAQTAGNLNVVVVGWNDSTASVTSLADTVGNSYSLAVGPTRVTGTLSQSIYYAKNIAGAATGANTVTVNFSVAAQFADIRILEYSGLDKTNPLDASAAGTGNGLTADSGQGTTASANELLIGANTVSTGNSGAGAGYAVRIITNPDSDLVEDALANAAGSYHATAPLTSGGAWVMQLAAFKAAPAAVPTAPTNLTATATSPAQINLSWTASTETGGTISQYLVERCQGASCSTFAQVGTSTTTTYSDAGLAGSTSYSYRVRAQDTFNTLGPYSGSATAVTPAPVITAPSNVTATAASPAQINLAWAASTETGGTLTTYFIERCQSAGCSNFVQVATTPDEIPSYSDTGLSGSTSYSYRVRAGDASNNLGPYSTSSSATTPAPTLTAPSSLTATAASSTQINLSWTASTETGGTISQYLVERCQGAGCSTFAQIGTSTTATYNDSGLTASTSYSYRVRATDASNNLSAYSTTASAATPATSPTAPGNLTAAAAGPVQVNLSWTASTEPGGTISQYLVERCAGAACSNFVQVGTSATTSHSDTGLSGSTAYSYRARAQDALNNLGPYSNTATATTAAPILTAPSSLTATPAGPAQINLSWTAATETGGTISQYLVERCQGSACSTFTQTGTSTTTNYSDAGLTGSTSYTYRVRATDAANNLSPYSPTAGTTTAAPVLTAPSNLAATPVSSVQINLSWTASTETGGAISQYLVERCTGSGCTSFAQVGTSNTTTFSNTGLLANTSYSYRVRASDASNNLSGYSNIATGISLSGAPAPISFVQVNAATPQTPQVSVPVAYTGAQAAGNLNVVAVGSSDATLTVVSVKDSAGNNYVLAVGPTVNAGNPMSQWIYYAKNIVAAGAGANTVTVTFSGAAAYADIRILEYSGIDSNNPLDGAVGAAGNSTAADSGALVTTNANDLLFAAGMTYTGFTGAGAGYLTRIITNPDADIAEDGVVSTTGSYHGTAPVSPVAGWVMQLAAFKGMGATPMPTAPSNLTATAAGPAQINLSWTASTEAGSTVGQYLVERCQNTGCSNFTQIGTSTSASYNDTTGLTGSTTYSYRVRARDTANVTGPYSATATATTAAPAFTAPSNLAATPSGPAQINLTWTASTETGGTISQYLVERCTGAGCSNFAQVGTSPTTTYSDSTNVNGSTAYNYRVRAKDAANNLGPYSNIAGATTPAPIFTAPSNLGATVFSSTQINLSWTAGTETGGTISQYLVERCSGTSCTTFTQIGTSPSTTYNDTTALPSTTFVYRVRATDAASNMSSYSNTATAITPTSSPTAPTNLTATAAGPVQINLSWTASTETGGTISQYLVERCTGASCNNFMQVGTSPTTSYSDAGLTGSTLYSYRARAKDSSNLTGPYSNIASATTAPPTFTPPSNLAATSVSSTQINLSWTAGSETGGAINQYLVERCQNAGCSNFAQVGTSTTTTFNNTGLLANTSYSYRIRASDSSSNTSTYSNTSSATTQPAQPPGVISFVQVNAATPQTPQVSVPVAYTGAQAAGNLNVVAVGSSDATLTVVSVKDSAGNNYVLAVGPTVNAGNPMSQSIYYAKNIVAAAAGANTVTVTFSGAAAYADIRILEYGGIDPNNPLDGAVGASGNSTAADSGAVVTTNANDLLFAAGMTYTGFTGAGAGYLTRIITNPDADIAEDGVVSATSSYHGTAPVSPAAGWVMQLAAFKGAAAAPAGLTVTPRAIALTAGKTQQFTANNGSVTWSVNGIAGGSPAVGTITAGGLYTPSAAVGSYTIQATTTSTPAQVGSATAYLTNYGGTLTSHNDVARTGQNLNETVLAPVNVNSAQFGKLFSCPIDASTYTQPLYVPGLTIGGAAHNVVFAATENDSVYALDADGPACTQLWMASMLDTTHGAASGATPVPTVDTGDTEDLVPIIGITGTPVIDSVTKTLYVVSKTKEGTAYFQRLHALSLVDGSEKFGGPATISGSVQGSGAGSSGGSLSFSALHENQRAALLLLNGQVYITWAGHGDTPPYHGWVMAYNASTLQQTAVFNSTPNGGDGGIWQSGAGPAADSSGNIYVVTGNGTFDTTASVPPVAPNNDFGQSFLKLSTSSGLALADFFTLFNYSSANTSDFDFGSGGPLLLPDSVGSAAHPHLAVAGDKQGNLYLVDRDAMGGYCPGCTTTNVNIVQQVNIATGGCITCGVFQTPAIWQGRLYIQPVRNVLKSFTISNGQISTPPSSQSAQTFGFPGATPVVSAAGSVNGIVWVMDTYGSGTNAGGANAPAVLHAYDALNVATELWNSSQAIGRDAAGNAVKFTVPTVANGRVYVGTQSGVFVYGLLP